MLLLAFTTGDSKSEYILPLYASSVCTVDLDLDNDIDIVVGHNYSVINQWSGVSIMLNEGNGYLDLFDSVFLFGGQRVQLANLNSNPLVEIIAKYEDNENEMEYNSIIYDFNVNNISYFTLNTYVGIDIINKGDINGDSFMDIVVASSYPMFWGVLYNNGTGNFSEPVYHITETNINDLTVSDIDDNGHDDIDLCGTDTEIYYSFETGFEYYLLSGIEHDIETADMDNDGDIDVITVWGAGVTTYLIYENLGYQNFQLHTIYTFQGSSGGLRVPDLNNDSLPEITFTSGYKYFILNNVGNLEFSEPDTILPDFSSSTTYEWADVDNNNYLDIIIIRQWNEYIPNLKILFNDGNGNFVENPITQVNTPNSKIQNSNLGGYPNPFTDETTIEFYLEEKTYAEISIYDLSGKEVKNLIHNNTKGGSNTIKWDGLDNGGKPCKPGPYLLTLKVNGNVLQTIKIIKY